MTSGALLTIYACQMDITWENKPVNFTRVHRLLEEAEPEAGGLIVLPEMFATGFSMNATAISEDRENSESAVFLSDLARDYRCHVLAGVVTNDPDGGRPRNEALCFSPDGHLMGGYAKQRPFTPSGEREHYAAGDSPIVLEINGLRIAPCICYDLRFPELFRNALDLGVDSFIVIASWPAARIHHWSALLQARAIENQAYVIGVNRTGSDPTPLSYPGRSVIIDPAGTVLSQANSREAVLRGTLDSAFIRRYREDLPFLQDR